MHYTLSVYVEFSYSLEVSFTAMYHLRVHPLGIHWHPVLQNVLIKHLKCALLFLRVLGLPVSEGTAPSLYCLAGQGHSGWRHRTCGILATRIECPVHIRWTNARALQVFTNTFNIVCVYILKCVLLAERKWIENVILMNKFILRKNEWKTVNKFLYYFRWRLKVRSTLCFVLIKQHICSIQIIFGG